MNHFVPDWSMEDNSRSLHHDLLPIANQKKSAAPDNELVELLWKNGHVVMQSQSNRKPQVTVFESRQDPKFDPSTKYGSCVGNSSIMIQEDGTPSWFQYPLDDSLDREFSEFFCGIPAADAVDTDKPNKDVLEEGERYVRFGAAEETNAFTMPPPKFGLIQQAPSLGNSNGLGSGSGVVVGIGETSSVRTVGSSACGSNQADMSHNLSNGMTGVRGRGVKDVQMSPLHEVAQTNTFDPTVTSSSGGSGCSFGRTVGQQNASNQNHKRKGRDGEDSECHSEEAEFVSIDANRPAQRSASTRKSRAAEVHNLSERRRRDRINEKMKALQELIPHCNKSDKASMLDEAIEYMKSLQLQLQIMWMGGGMAPMMFPGVQQYMSQVPIGMGHASMPSINNPIQLPRIPQVNHSMPSTASANQMPVCQSPVLNPINFPTQKQNVHLPESYARYVGFPHMQLPPQAMNLYAYGSHMVQQNQTAAAAGSSSLPTARIPLEKIQNGQSG